MFRRTGKSRWLPIVLALAATSATLAGPAPSTCVEGSVSRCDFRSDVFLFAAGDPEFEIRATVEECHLCTDNGDGTFSFDGEISVEFGPYEDLGLCAPQEDWMNIFFLGDVMKDPNIGPEPAYVPADDTTTYVPNQNHDLRTECVAEGNLNYVIPQVLFRGSDGARTDATTGNQATLVYPNSVRSTGGKTITFNEVRLKQDLTFRFQETNTNGSFRFWPDGMPFRMTPGDVTFEQDRVSLDTIGGIGPAYEVIVPVSGGGAGEVGCRIPEFGLTWNCNARWNAGWLDHTSWAPSNVSFTHLGFQLELDLPSTAEVDFEPAFPEGVWVRLDGPAAATMVDGTFVDGGFDGGTMWIEYGPREVCDDAIQSRRFTLNDDRLGPRITQHGGILAGVADLNEQQPGDTGPEPFTFTFNSLTDLGCGTLWIPPLQADTFLPGGLGNPQDVQVLARGFAPEGRGLYAGLNYNRNLMCVGGTNANNRCSSDTDCPGGTCDAGIWSPVCPGAATPPDWAASVNELPPVIKNVPADDLEKELVFYVRSSGVTGVFDGGIDPTPLNDPNGFKMDFNSWGHAFKGNRSEYADTVMRGAINFPWPSSTMIPFGDMRLCNCGEPKDADVPSGIAPGKLKYWDAEYLPYGLAFTSVPGDTDAQCQGDKATSVEVTASTPVPHFQPTPTSDFSLDPNGVPGAIQPVDFTQFEFEPNSLGLQPYTYDVSKFELQPWAGFPSECQVYDCDGFPPPTQPLGRYDAIGEIDVPWFGSTEGDTVIRRTDVVAATYQVDVHEPGFPDVPSKSSILASRTMANGTIDLQYRLDYFRPEGTKDPNDGENENGVGVFLGYADQGGGQRSVQLGSVPVASGIQTRHGVTRSDLGAGSVLRLWDAMLPSARDELDSIVPASLLNPFAGAYNGALAKLGGALPEPQALTTALHDSGALADLASHPDLQSSFAVAAPGMNASKMTGHLDLSADGADLAFLDATIDTGGQFFGLDRSTLSIDRHVKDTANGALQPIQEFSRRQIAGAMSMPAEQSIDFPNVPGMQWDFDFDVSGSPPSFTFNSLTGSLDLTKGGLSGIGFDKAGMTLKYWADGDWYFDAGLKLKFNGYGAHGDILLGNCKTMEPLKALDPTVGKFLNNLNSFQGGYARLGVQGNIFDFGCLLRVSAGMEVGGWYISDNFGGKVRGWVSGKGACLVSVRGDLTLLGNTDGDVFKLAGDMWVGGGFGFCEEDEWDSPSDVLNDGWCASCVVRGNVTGKTPPKFKIKMSGPKVKCSL